MSTSDKWRKARRRDLSASRPAEAGSSQAKPGQERRVRLKDPAATGATLPGLTTLSPETATARAPTRCRGEERQDGRVGEEKVWPEPKPGEGELRGVGDGTRSRGEKHGSGIHRKPKPAMVGYWRLTMETGFWEHGG